MGSGATGTITVTTPGGTATSSGTFTFIPAPTITSFTPTSGGAGTVVTITGTNFTGATAVAFGGTAAASFTVTSATSHHRDGGQRRHRDDHRHHPRRHGDQQRHLHPADGTALHRAAEYSVRHDHDGSAGTGDHHRSERSTCYHRDESGALTLGAGSGTLSGTLTQPAVNGVATFSDLAISSAGSYTLQASATGSAGAVSTPFTITPLPAPPVISNITAMPATTMVTVTWSTDVPATLHA